MKKKNHGFLALLMTVPALFGFAAAMLPCAFAADAGTSRLAQSNLNNEEKAGQLGLGVQAGNFSGLSMEYWLDNARTLNVGLVGENQNIAISVAHVWMFRDIVAREFSHFVPYAGAGLIGANGTSHSNTFRREINGRFGLAAQVPLGFEYLPRIERFGLFAEVVPSLELTPSSIGFLSADVGARYYF